jgi:DNA-binding CsgD family transcriptional regulator
MPLGRERVAAGELAEHNTSPFSRGQPFTRGCNTRVMVSGGENGGRARLEIGLVARSDEIERALIEQTFKDVHSDGRDWLRARYAELVPLVLRDALRSVETGEALPDECLVRLRAAAAELQDESAPVGVMLRGSLPALRVFSSIMHDSGHVTDPAHMRTVVTAMGRAALVAHELGVCWIEGRNDSTLVSSSSSSAASGGRADGTLTSLELVATSPDLDDAEERMLVLAALGHSNEVIATATSYSRQAVGWHLSRIMRVWKAPNRTALVALAFVKGVLVPRRAQRALPSLPNRPVITSTPSPTSIPPCPNAQTETPGS